MKHEKTFAAIKKLQEVEIELHRMKNLLEIANKASDAKRTWVGLTDEEIDQGLLRSDYALKTAEAWRAGVVFAMTKLKEKNT